MSENPSSGRVTHTNSIRCLTSYQEGRGLIDGGDDPFASRHERKESGNHRRPIEFGERSGKAGEIERGTRTVMKKKDGRKLRPLRPILEEKSGDEKTSKFWFRKIDYVYTGVG